MQIEEAATGSNIPGEIQAGQKELSTTFVGSMELSFPSPKGLNQTAVSYILARCPDWQLH